MTTFALYGPSAVPAISLRPRQAAQALSISLSTLERLTKSGEIPATKIGRCNLYAVDSLKAWLDLRSKGGRHASH
jgi:excisionase family DNA binding protein